MKVSEWAATLSPREESGFGSGVVGWDVPPDA